MSSPQAPTAFPPPAQGQQPAPAAADPGEVAIKAAPGPVDRAPVRARHAAPSTPTPTVLRRLRALAVVLTLVFAVVMGAVVLATQSTMAQGAATTDQYARVQDARANLLSAQALAASDVLQGSPAQLARFRAKVERAQQLITDAAVAQPADRPELDRAATAVVRYAESVQAARGAAKQGLPVTAPLLAQAQTVLDKQAVPALDAVVTASHARLDAHRTVLSPWIVWGAGAVTIAVLLLACVLVARRTHRVLNLGLVLAILLTGAATYVAASALTGGDQLLGRLQQQDQAAIVEISDARAEAARAKTHETLALIARQPASGTDETAWRTGAAKVAAHLAKARSSAGVSAPTAEWQAYTEAHQDIRAKADAGDPAGATALAVGTAAESSNPAYVAFDTAAATTAEASRARAADEQLALSRSLLRILPLALLLSLAALAAAASGLGARLREYRA